jgi:lipoprotein-anchoring transpeptidase ErfK/SrfK
MNTLLLISLLFSPSYDQMGTNNKMVLVDLNKMVWIAFQGGQEVRRGDAVGGSTRCSDNKRRNCKSPIGTFTVKSKHSRGYRSHRYPLDCKNFAKCGARMYYAMHLSSKSGEALHGSDMMVGYNASHGCIRLHPKDAEWLNKNFVEIGTQVTIIPY